MYLNLVLDEILIYNNGFYNMFNLQTDFEHNDIYRYVIPNNKT